MTDVATRAGVSKATLYRRWTAKADLVADAVARLSVIESPLYPGTSLRDDLIAFVERAATAMTSLRSLLTMEMARLHPDLYKTLSARFHVFVRAELDTISERYAPLSEVQLDAISDTVIALLAHHAGPAAGKASRERLLELIDNIVMVLMTAPRR